MVAVESPTYYGLLQVVESLQLQTLEIPCSPRTGMSIEALELAFQTQPRLKAVVVVPELQMPLGARMPDEHKAGWWRCAPSTGGADRGRFLWPVCRRQPAGQAAQGLGQRVRPCDLLPGLQQSLAPGLRQGWMNGGWHGRMQMLKFAQSRNTQTLGQLVVAEVLGSPAHQRSLERLGAAQAQREAMARLVARHFPVGTRMSLPAGGLCLWLELPEGFSSAQLFGDALAQGIRIAPGSMFSNSGRYEHCMRLACTTRWMPRWTRRCSCSGAWPVASWARRRVVHRRAAGRAQKTARADAGGGFGENRLNYFSLVSLYSTCLRALGSNFMIDIFSGIVFLFLVVV
jgi:hypothetical protein